MQSFSQFNHHICSKKAEAEGVDGENEEAEKYQTAETLGTTGLRNGGHDNGDGDGDGDVDAELALSKACHPHVIPEWQIAPLRGLPIWLRQIPSWCPAPTIIEAVGHFMDKRVLSPRPSVSAVGYIEEVANMYRRTAPSSLLHLVTNTIATASFASFQSRVDLLHVARHMYGKALNGLRTALSSPQSRNDEILMSSLLLGFYEVAQIQMTFANNKRTIEQSPMAQIDLGNTALGLINDVHQTAIPSLLKHRGRAQLVDPVSRRIFFCLQHQLTLVCLARGTLLEDFLGELASVQDDDKLNVGTQMSCIGVFIPVIVADIKRVRSSPHTSDVRAEAWSILDRAIDLDDRLHHWASTAPNAWHFRQVTDLKEWLGDMAFSDTGLVYPGVWIANVWNSYRILRITLNLAIMELLQHLTDIWAAKVAPRLARCASIVHEMCDDMCATVPFFVGDQSLQSSSDLPVRFPDLCGLWDQRFHAEGMRGDVGVFSMLIPLMFCLRIPFLDRQQRTWLSNQLLRLQRLDTCLTAFFTVHASLTLERMPILYFARAINSEGQATVVHENIIPPIPKIPPSKASACRYKCDEPGCGALPFSSSSNLHRHRRERHGASKTFNCPRCQRSFTRREACRSHIQGGRCKGKSLG